MKLTKCENGHFFDSDRYGDCPYCKKSTPAVTQPGDAAQETENGSADVRTAPDLSGQAPLTVPKEADLPKKAVTEKEAEDQAPSLTEDRQEPEAPKQNEAPVSKVWQPASDDMRTVSFYERMVGTEPVVGWLVATEGPYFGEDFKLKAGRNFIGRSPEMDIQLSMDLTVSRRRHAVIIYEPRGKVFIAQPGDSRELFYINDEVVLGNVQMKPYDILSIGETKLLFMPLCGKEFTWEDIKKR